MDRGKMRRIVLLLIAVSALIYGLQILIFHDVRNTAFYILQDFAFMPVTIAVATLVVGELIAAQEKKERQEKTRMLTSTFYTELGARLMALILRAADDGAELASLADRSVDCEEEERRLRRELSERDIRVSINEEIYESSRKLILDRRVALLVISSNPMLLEHEDFTDMLWGVFHLIDEFRLRGDYSRLSEEDIRHLNEDFSQVLKLMLMNWVSNARYLKEAFPNYYSTAREKAIQSKWNIR